MPTTKINDVMTHYEVHGEGTPALFIHGGFGGPATTLTTSPKPIVEAAPLGRVSVITYDRRCAGQSEYVLDSPYSLEQIAADANALLRHLGHGRAIIIGSSMGGMVAQQYALSFPDEIQALALLNTGPALMSTTPWGARMSKMVDRVAAEGAEATYDSVKDLVRSSGDDDPAIAAFRALAMSSSPQNPLSAALESVSDEDLFRYWRGSIRNEEAFIGFDFRDRLSKVEAIEVPKIIVHGDSDSIIPYADAELLHASIPSAELHCIDQADHGITSYPAAQAVIRDWLLRVA